MTSVMDLSNALARAVERAAGWLFAVRDRRARPPPRHHDLWRLQTSSMRGARRGVSRLVEEVVRRGRIPRAYLGVGTQPVELPKDLRKRLNLAQRTALIVVSVNASSPTGETGVVIGDFIVAIAGRVIAEPEDLVAVLRPDRVGTVVTMSIVRGGEPRDLEVTVGERRSRA